MSSSPHCFVGAVQKIATKGNTEIRGQELDQTFFYWQSFAKKKTINQKIENELILEVFRSDKKRVKIVKIITFIFQCVAPKKKKK